MSIHEFEFGLDSPAYVTVDESGQPLDGTVVIRNTIEEAVFADRVGIDSFNISEHYRPDFMDSAGHVMLAAIANRPGVAELTRTLHARPCPGRATLRPVNQIQIDIVCSEPLQATLGLGGRILARRIELGRDKHLVARTPLSRSARPTLSSLP